MPDGGSFPRNLPLGDSIPGMDKDANTDNLVPQPSEKELVDLSALQDFDFGPSWSDATSAKPARKETGPRRSRPARKRGGPTGKRDRRPSKPRISRGADRAYEGKRQSGKRSKPPHRFEPPKKVVEVAFYPEEKGFRALCRAMKATSITYELFDIARILLKKPERHTVVIHPLQVSGEEADSGQGWFYVVKADGMPFLDEPDAIQHALSRCLDHCFTAETVQVDPPRGVFNTVRRCGITGELLGPPNYHRCKEITRDHHANRLPNMPFHKFESRIETVRDEAVIQAWVEKMKTLTRYTLKPEYGGERVFQEAELARAYVRAHLRDKLVSRVKTLRLEGGQTRELADPLIKANVEFSRDREIRFPLHTANRLRGRLRGQNFALFKRGSKGVSYVCAVKRKFRRPGQIFSDRVQQIIEFLEGHPGIPVREFSEQYLGFGIFGKETESAPELTEEQNDRLKALRVDFQWLLKEGYISEYADGKVFAHPIRSTGAKTKEELTLAKHAKNAKKGRKTTTEDSENTEGDKGAEGANEELGIKNEEWGRRE